MTVRPIQFNGMIQNSQDVSSIQQHENNRPAIEQQNIQIEQEKKQEQQSQEVQQKDNVNHEEQKFDAKEKGSNEYSGKKQKKKKQPQNLPDGTVRVKMTSGFDIKV